LAITVSREYIPLATIKRISVLNAFEDPRNIYKYEEERGIVGSVS